MSRAHLGFAAFGVLLAGAMAPPEEARSANGVKIPPSARSAAFTVW